MKTILVIEANEAVRENTAELLELAGYRVVTACNGLTGFDEASTLFPDLIICDIVMPDTDGRRFLKMIKSDDQLSQIPLIFFSAGPAPEDVRRKVEQVADKYLAKPFNDEDLLNAVTSCLRKASA